MKNQVLAALAVIIVLTAFYVNVGNASPQASLTLQSSGVVQQTPTPTPTPAPTPTPTPTPTGPYSYIISVSGSNYQMTDGTTGQIVFQSTNSSQVFSNVVGNCSVGSSIDVKSGVYVVNTMWTMIHVNNVTMNFENGAKLVAGNNLNTSVLALFQSNDCIINGITIDGNAANQVINTPTVSPINPGGHAVSPALPNGIYIGGSNDKINNAVIYNCRIMGVSIFADGYYVTSAVHSGVVNSKIYNCGWNGFTATGVTVDCYLINSEIYGCSDVGASTYGVGTQITGNYVHDLNGTTGGGGNAKWGIAVEGGCNDVITQNTIQNCSIGIANTGYNNCTISDNTITGGGSTSRPQYGIYLSNDGGAGCKYNSVTDNYVTGMYCNTDLYQGGIGILLSGATFNLISGNVVSQCGSNGILLDGTSNNNTVSLNIVSDTTAGYFYGAYQYAGCGIQIAGSNNYISQNQVFDDRSGASRTQQYGIAMESSSAYGGVASKNILIGNNVYGNINAQIYDGNVPENTMINNIGYNPVGYIANPISGSTAYLVDSGSNSTWICGRVYTNTGSPKLLNISGGTVSVVAQNGVTLFTATGCTVTLQPGDTFSVTFSTAPTINVIGQ